MAADNKLSLLNWIQQYLSQGLKCRLGIEELGVEVLVECVNDYATQLI